MCLLAELEALTWQCPKQGKPAAKGGYIELSDFEIVTTFGAQLRGLVNYYGYATNIGKALNRVRWDCMECARKNLLCSKKDKKKRKNDTETHIIFALQLTDKL